MSTVSLVECVIPSSLRTCGSTFSKRTHLENRRRLQIKSPDKILRLTPTPKPKVPYIRGLRGISLSPASVGSPRRTFATSPTKWPYECNNDELNESGPSEESGDEDLDEICGSQEVARMLSHSGSHEDLQVVGSKPKLHSMFEVPVSVITPSIKPKVGDQHKLTENKADPDFDRNSSDSEFDRGCSSPENPPPSPINFTQSSMDGFVVGGKKLQCPKRTNIGMSYNVRDFNPGFVKYPLFHCQKCEERVLDEEQSQSALQRRQEEYIRSRASPYKAIDRHQMMGSRLSQRSRPDSQPNVAECEHDARSFLEIYMEKKKQKEQREMERKKREAAKTKDGQNDQRPETLLDTISAVMTMTKLVESDTQVSNKQDSNSTDTSGSYFHAVSKASLSLLKQHTKRRYNQALRETPDTRQASSTTASSDSFRRVTCDVSDLSSAVTMQVEDSERFRQNHVASTASDVQPSVLDKCQVRPCRSDIWPFHEQEISKTLKEAESTEKLRPKTTMRNINARHSKLRLTPYCPLPDLSIPGSAPNLDVRRSKSDVSLTLSSYHVVEADEIEAVEIPDTYEDAGDVKEDEDSTNDITLTTTVIVPPKDKPCSQWVTFNTDHEPVLNNAPITNEGCDSFLKRLQRTQLYLKDTGSPIPTGEVCYEPVIDKRYNRWKRRKRKKKEVENRRPAINVDSGSSDDDNERAVERIIGQMYIQIHGNPPETPNGTSDTPRMRNRRRRRELVTSGSKADGLKAGQKETNYSNNLHYDASSEWLLSDASDEELDKLRSRDKDDEDDDDDKEYDETVTNDSQSKTSPNSSNDSASKSKDSEEHAQSEPTSPPIPRTLSFEGAQMVSPEYEGFSTPDCEQNIYVECERRPIATEPTQKQEQYKNNDDNQDRIPKLLFNLNTENRDNRNTEYRDTPDIEEELRRCFSGRCYSVDIDEEPTNNRVSSCDMYMPYLNQYREEIMERVKDSPTDEILNKDWLPDIPRPACPDSPVNRHPTDSIVHRNPAESVVHRLPKNSPIQRRPTFEIVENEMFPKPRTPKIPDPMSRLRGEIGARLNKRRNWIPRDFNARTKREDNHIPCQPKVDAHNDTKEKVTMDKPRQFITPKTPEEEPRPISRSGPSCWSELGYNPEEPKSVGLVSVAAPADIGLKLSSSQFKASFRPVRRQPVKPPIKTDLKDFGILKRKVLSLPKITKTSKSQTVPSYQRRNSIINTEESSKERDRKTDSGSFRRPNTMPQSQHHEQKNSNNANLDPRAECMFKDYYLRSLYKSKPHSKSQSKQKTINSPKPAKETITVEKIDLGKKKEEKGKELKEERSVSNLSFTRAFTFSIFDLPDFYKMYNKRIERKAR